MAGESAGGLVAERRRRDSWWAGATLVITASVEVARWRGWHPRGREDKRAVARRAGSSSGDNRSRFGPRAWDTAWPWTFFLKWTW